MPKPRSEPPPRREPAGVTSLQEGRRTFVDSLADAIDGLLYAVRHERQLKVHFVIGLAALLFCAGLQIRGTQLLLVFFAVSMVLAAEMVNTAIETVVNLLTTSHHPLAKIAKDVAAGAVLIACVNALAVAWVVLVPALASAAPRASAAGPQAALAAALSLLGILVLRLIGRRGQLHRLEVAAGHAVLTFGAATAFVLVTEHPGFAALAFPVSWLVGRRRVESGLHRWPEVAAGAVAGVALSLAVLWLLSATLGPEG